MAYERQGKRIDFGKKAPKSPGAAQPGDKNYSTKAEAKPKKGIKFGR